MTPRVFVSSTIRDLAHLRHALRDAVIELGYQPVMSDFGEIGYLPEVTAADSCFKEAENCDLGILIVAKRYGDDYINNVSVTHGEFRTLRGRKVPIVTLVEKDVLTYKALVEANPNATIACPGMDRPKKTFELVDEVGNCAYNNGIHEFQQLGDARRIVRQQFGHIFGNLLRERYDPVRGDIKDILASIAALRDEVRDQKDDPESNRFLRASRELLEDECQHFKKFTSTVYGGFDVAVHKILQHATFDDLVAASGRTIEQEEPTGFMDGQHRDDDTTRFGEAWGGPRREGQPFGMHYMVSDSRVYISEGALEQLRANHLRVRAAAGTH